MKFHELIRHVSPRAEMCQTAGMSTALPQVALPQVVGLPNVELPQVGTRDAAFGSLGRFCMALDQGFRIRHVSDRLDALLGPGAVQRIRGEPIESILGAELFGPAGPLRQALLSGETREGWRALL